MPSQKSQRVVADDFRARSGEGGGRGSAHLGENVFANDGSQNGIAHGFQRFVVVPPLPLGLRGAVRQRLKEQRLVSENVL